MNACPHAGWQSQRITRKSRGHFYVCIDKQQSSQSQRTAFRHTIILKSNSPYVPTSYRLTVSCNFAGRFAATEKQRAKLTKLEELDKLAVLNGEQRRCARRGRGSEGRGQKIRVGDSCYSAVQEPEASARRLTRSNPRSSSRRWRSSSVCHC
jgi:hypothetical protein